MVVAEAGIPARPAVIRGSNLEVGGSNRNLRRWVGAATVNPLAAEATVSPPQAEATVNRRKLLLRNKVGGNHRAEHRRVEHLRAIGLSPRAELTEAVVVVQRQAGLVVSWPRLRSAERSAGSSARSR